MLEQREIEKIVLHGWEKDGRVKKKSSIQKDKQYIEDFDGIKKSRQVDIELYPFSTVVELFTGYFHIHPSRWVALFGQKLPLLKQLWMKLVISIPTWIGRRVKARGLLAVY